MLGTQHKLSHLTHTSRRTEVKTDFHSSELIVMMLQKWPRFGPQHPTRQGKTPEGSGWGKTQTGKERMSDCSITILHRSLERTASNLQPSPIPAPRLTAWVTTRREENRFVRCLLTQDLSTEQVPPAPLALNGMQKWHKPLISVSLDAPCTWPRIWP